MAGHQSRGWCTYLPTTVNQYGAAVSIKVDNTTATNNGNAVSPSPPQAVYWPGHRADLRCSYGIDTTKAKDSCTAFSGTGTLFALGSTFKDNLGNVYTTNGLRSERFRTRNLK